MNKLKLFVLIAGLMVAAVILLPQKNNEFSKKNTYTKQKQLELKLLDKIVNLEPESIEAKDLNLKYKKLRALRKGKLQNTENPMTLLDAFRQIKTGPDGKTYSANYRKREFLKAKEQIRSLAKRAQLPWIERGPGNISGRSRAVIVDPDDPSKNTWFIGTVGGGVWKTTDAGLTWENKTPELTSLSTVCMAMAESNHNVIYVGTGMGYGRTVDLAGNGIWKSTDRGETWTQLQSTANGELLPAINRIIVNPNDENIVLVCSNGDYTSNGPNQGSRESGIFRTTDGGKNWTQVYDPELVFGSKTDNRVQQIIANPDNFNIIYGAVNEVGVIKSTDGGKNWQTVADNFADPADIGFGEGSYQGISTRVELAIAPTDPNRIYASVERSRGISKLFMSKDAGSNWNEVIDLGNNPNWFSYGGADGANSYTGGWFNNTIVVHPYNENIVFVGGIELYRILIYPNNNTRKASVIADRNTVHVDHHYLVSIPVNESTNDFKLLCANDGGAAFSNDGGTSWSNISGMGSNQFYGMDKKPGKNVYIGGLQDNNTVLSQSNPAVNSIWTRVIGGDGFEAVWNYRDPNLIIGASQNGNYWRSTDGGNSWNPIADARPGNGAPFITKIGFSKTDPDLIFTVGATGVKRSDDFGASWTSTPITKNWIGTRAFDNVEVSIADPQIVYISSRMNYESFIGKQGGIHLSKDGGITFNEISQNFPSTVVEASGISTHPTDPGTAYFLFSVAGKPKVLRTTDYGETFEDISGFSGQGSNGFPDVAVYQILVMPYNTNIIWAGTEIGLFISEDKGETWKLADNGLPYVGIFQMSIVDDQILVATYGRGLWSVTLPELSDYKPNEVTLVPRLNPLVQNTEGNIEINIELRSAYDSTVVWIDNQAALKIGSTTIQKDTTLYYPVTQDRELNAYVASYSEGREYRTAFRNITANVVAVKDFYSANFNNETGQSDFIGDLFTVKTIQGFSNSALHSPHLYPNASELISRIKNPIRVSASNANLEFDEIVLVEEGIVNDYQNVNFFDYVIVEASKDGITWLPLVNGYDSRANSAWSARIKSNIVGNDSYATGNESLFVTRKINLLNKFSAGDIIFIRFRLVTDALAVAWGWTIDNIKIQVNNVGVDENDNIPEKYTLSQNYPNPFNPSTTIEYAIPQSSKVVLRIFDAVGQTVATLVNEEMNAGRHKIEWNASQLTSGVYFYQINANGFSQTKKLMLIK